MKIKRVSPEYFTHRDCFKNFNGVPWDISCNMCGILLRQVQKQRKFCSNCRIKRRITRNLEYSKNRILSKICISCGKRKYNLKKLCFKCKNKNLLPSN